MPSCLRLKALDSAGRFVGIDEVGLKKDDKVTSIPVYGYDYLILSCIRRNFSAFVLSFMLSQL